MATHRFHPTRYFNVIGTAEPCLRVADGDTVITDTLDASGLDAREVAVASRPNPMTGPFFIEGAEPGDTLAVRIDRLTPSRATGWTYSPLAADRARPRRDPRPPAAAARGVGDRPRGRHGAAAGTAEGAGGFRPAHPADDRLLRRRAGRRAGAVHRDQRAERRQHGLPPVRPGTTAWFPVSVPGALFYLGDGHACQGDGEIVGTGIETSFEMEVTFRVLKRKITWPRGETADDIFTVGNARPLDQALQHATTEMCAGWARTTASMPAPRAT
jgi:amidase